MGGRGELLLIRNPKKDFYPEKHRDEGPLLVSDKEICPERAQRVEGPLCIPDEGICPHEHCHPPLPGSAYSGVN